MAYLNAETDGISEAERCIDFYVAAALSGSSLMQVRGGSKAA